ncbi:unnamed protein product [Brachionus calyciflorus]|uniref:Reverse transcriptase/retrotransposon-derived protein RNase H-like domain-containing protein n=1 Tax=Brachionus calyciflorus TaxID=104777 RepID=A0A814GJS2_9BILA|nr:unnamed protein product [Brachionus calyciflorus]
MFSVKKLKALIKELLEKLERAGLLQNAKFNWDEKSQGAFDQLKNALTSECVLMIPDFEKRFYLETDASNKGIGEQMDENNQLRPIAYYSRKLCKSVPNYSASEKEIAGKKNQNADGLSNWPMDKTTETSQEDDKIFVINNINIQDNEQVLNTVLLIFVNKMSCQSNDENIYLIKTVLNKKLINLQLINLNYGEIGFSQRDRQLVNSRE